MIELKYQKPFEEIPDDAYDGRRFIFPYNVTILAQGKGYDKNEVKKIIVSISKLTIRRWDYKNDDEIIKVLFEYVRNFIFDKLLDNNLKDVEKLDIPRAKYGEEKPFDPGKIVDYPPVSFTLDIDELRKEKNKGKMGF